MHLLLEFKVHPLLWFLHVCILHLLRNLVCISNGILQWSVFILGWYTTNGGRIQYALYVKLSVSELVCKINSYFNTNHLDFLRASVQFIISSKFIFQ